MNDKVVGQAIEKWSSSDLAYLDHWHQRNGNYPEWMMSSERAHIAGPNRFVRIVTWNNLHELCQKAGMDEQKAIVAYKESLSTEDVLFIEWEESTNDENTSRNRLDRSINRP